MKNNYLQSYRDGFGNTREMSTQIINQEQHTVCQFVLFFSEIIMILLVYLNDEDSKSFIKQLIKTKDKKKEQEDIKTSQYYYVDTFELI